MDNKRVLSRFLVPRKGPGICYKHVKEDANAQSCNRIGCSGKLNYAKGIRTGCSEKTEPLTPTGSSNGKEIVKIPSTAVADIANRKIAPSQRRSHFNQKPENDGGISTSFTRTHRVIGTGNKELGCGKTKLSGVGSSSVSSNIRPWRKSPAMSGDGKQKTSPGSKLSSSSKDTTSMTCCGIINVKSKKISDVIPGSPPIESKVNRRGETRQRYPDGESSRGNKITAHSSNERPSPQPKSGICISDVRSSRGCTSGVGIGRASEISGRSGQVNNRVAHFNRSKRNSATVGDSSLATSGSRGCQTRNSSELNVSYQHNAEGSSSHSRSPATIVASDTLGSVPSTSTEVGITRFRNRDAYWQYNIAEVLMDLERIEYSEDIAYERLLDLDTELFLSSLNVFDHHRGMRMDIDNMSYEELLALEERMGTVSTALSEEAITKCLQKSIYQPQASDEEDSEFGYQNDIKCSICQEEYLAGVEVGNLGCEHSYHVECIEQWLRVKNWCPVCKGAAAETNSSSRVHHTS